eukprot:3858991-Amphidinium_carterae.1
MTARPFEALAGLVNVGFSSLSPQNDIMWKRIRDALRGEVRTRSFPQGRIEGILGGMSLSSSNMHIDMVAFSAQTAQET